MYTDNLQKEAYSRAYVQAVAALAKCNIESRQLDIDSIDISLHADVPDGRLIKKTQIDIQLKCTSQNIFHADGLHFPLPIKNFNDLKCRVLNQRLLVVVCVPDGDENWAEQDREKLCLKKCAYWLAPSQFPDSDNQTAVTVKIPYENIFSAEKLMNAMKTIADGGIL